MIKTYNLCKRISQKRKSAILSLRKKQANKINFAIMEKFCTFAPEKSSFIHGVFFFFCWWDTETIILRCRR